MIDKNKIIEQLKKNKKRITPIRSALINILSKNLEPLSPQEILKKINRLGLTANKTTIYRQLESLTRDRLVNEIHLNDRTSRYELAGTKNHHHHLVCLKCKKIEDVTIPNDLKNQEKTVWEKNKFKILQHYLEFFGYCKVCQRKNEVG